jgi:aminoglycoside phosphotransferase (APT) family kinase protein
VVCHNDLSPCNFVFQEGKPIAIIDFDAAAPGPRLHDFGYAAWMWLIWGMTTSTLIARNIDWESSRRHMISIKPTYVVEAMVRRQVILLAQAKRVGNAEMAEWVASCLQWIKHNLELPRPLA